MLSLDERAPNSLGNDAKKLTPIEATVRLARDGIISYESEILATANLITTMNRIAKTKPTIQRLKEGIKSLYVNGTLPFEDTPRR